MRQFGFTEWDNSPKIEKDQPNSKCVIQLWH